MTIHMIKLCVGADELADLEAWQAHLMHTRPAPVHHTRMMPKRSDELQDGGSIYWVIKGLVQVRQRITDVREIMDHHGQRACELVFDPELVPVETLAKRPFQGWRYLKPSDAPADLKNVSGGDAIPAALQSQLRDALVW